MILPQLTTVRGSLHREKKSHKRGRRGKKSREKARSPQEKLRRAVTKFARRARNRVPPGPYDTSTCAALRRARYTASRVENTAQCQWPRRRRQRATHTSGARVLYAPSSSQQKWPKSAPQTPRRPPPRQSLYSIRASTVSFVCSFVAVAISSVAPNLRDMVTRSSYVHETRTVPIEVHVGSVVSATSPARRGDRSVVNAG